MAVFGVPPTRPLAFFLGTLFCMVALGTAPPAPARASDEALPADNSAALSPVDPAAPIEIPSLLTASDARRYRHIFALQEGGHWADADRLIAKLEDRLLLGHVLAQRYLHPTRYRSSYKELKAWMDDYADHPDARRIYGLALKRKPKSARAPVPPLPTAAPSAFSVAAEREGAQGPADPRKRLNAADRLAAEQAKQRIRWYLSKGWTLAAKKLLLSDDIKSVFHAIDYDSAAARLGAGYFGDGRDDWALEWAGKAAERSGRFVPEAHWTAGLAAWRLKRYPEAARHFEAIAMQDNISPWMISAGAFWAARSHLIDRRPQQVNRLLGVAAEHPRTFYGMLARRTLGIETTFRWTSPELETAALKELATTPAGRRALALLQIENFERAENDLRLLSMRSNADNAQNILALAGRLDMPALAVRLDRMLFPVGGGFDVAAYPVPRWAPEGGFRVDRALIYALIRQESGFNPQAKSWAGARGLMQLMPRTASYVARDRRLRGSKRHALYSPATNIALGQKYIEMLLAEPYIKGDLLLLAAAWNGGPGNLIKWRQRTDDADDPLLFIESIPLRETRDFIERVLANLWIYRDRMGQPNPSLDAIAAGDWPVYTALDPENHLVAENGDRVK